MSADFDRHECIFIFDRAILFALFFDKANRFSTVATKNHSDQIVPRYYRLQI